MGAYDNAVAYLDAEVHPRCDYDIYSGMRDIVDEMEAEIERMRINERNALRERDRLRSENAKLRELVRDLHKALFTLDIDHCQACSRDNINGPCTKFAPWGNDECSIEEVMCELGIEVKE